MLSCWTLGAGGAAEGVMKMMLGNHIGFELDESFNENELFEQCYGAFLCELDGPVDLPGSAILVGRTAKGYALQTPSATVNMDKLQKTYEDKLQPCVPVFKPRRRETGSDFLLRLCKPIQSAGKNRETPCADSRIPRNQL